MSKYTLYSTCNILHNSDDEIFKKANPRNTYTTIWYMYIHIYTYTCMLHMHIIIVYICTCICEGRTPCRSFFPLPIHSSNVFMSCFYTSYREPGTLMYTQYALCITVLWCVYQVIPNFQESGSMS